MEGTNMMNTFPHHASLHLIIFFLFIKNILTECALRSIFARGAKAQYYHVIKVV